jgi:hypothetical protein
LCGIRPKHSNISKGGGLQFVWYWDQNSGNVMFYQLVGPLVTFAKHFFF